MSIYERMGINEEAFNKMEAFGLLRSNAKRDLMVFEYYLEQCKKVGSMQAMVDASEKYSITEDVTQKIIYKYKSKTLIIQ